MKKLIEGIVEFRQASRASYLEKYSHLAQGQSPDTLFIACSDSRVVPNTFASANPGDLFVIRNVGNLIAPADAEGLTESDEAEGAAIEFAIQTLGVRDIIVCGHSECGAMQAVLSGGAPAAMPHLKAWLRHGKTGLERMKWEKGIDAALAPHNQLSQVNVLVQLAHLLTYPAIRQAKEAGKLRLHAWWFDLAHADVYSFDETQKKYQLIDESSAPALLEEIS